MFGGGGDLNPRKMEQMMNQMGLDMEQIDAEEVIIRTVDSELVFENPDVNRMDARGQETYQVLGSPTERPREATSETADGSQAVPEEDVELVINRTGATAEDARAALERHDGDLAAAVADLE